MSKKDRPIEEESVAEESIPEEEAIAQSTSDLAQELAAAQAQIAELEKVRIYQQAEFQNYRRRRDEEFVAQQKYIAGSLLKDLLPILDNFDRAMQAAELSQSFEKLITGVQGTAKQLQVFLEKSGVTPMEALGKEFDPEFHEAIGYTEESDLPPNTVAEEIQRGYMIHERVLRPALVKVSSS